VVQLSILKKKKKAGANLMPSSPEKRREQYLANREEILAYAADYRKAHPEERQAYTRKYQEEHKEELAKKQAERYAAWRLENPKIPLKTHCINGHLKTPENLKGNRSCKLCEAAREKAAGKIRRAHARELRGPKMPKTHCRNGHPEDRNAQGECRACRLAYDKRSAKKSSEASKARRLERNRVWLDSSTGKPVSIHRRADFVAHGWTQQMYETTLFEQGNVCALCRLPFTKNNRPCADHRHSKPPEPRGLLHSHCNSLIGFAKDNPETCRAAAEYLEAWA
jgi:hypothetical protein